MLCDTDSFILRITSEGEGWSNEKYLAGWTLRNVFIHPNGWKTTWAA